MGFKVVFFLGLILVILLNLGCEREFLNPNDPKTPTLTWGPDSFVGDLNRKTGIVNFSWSSPTENISHFLLNWNLNGNNFEEIVSKEDNNFRLKWNAFDTIWLSSVADKNISSNQFISNSKPAINNNFFFFLDLSLGTRINPSSAEFRANIFTFDNSSFPNFQIPDVYLDDLVLILNSNNGIDRSLPTSLLNTGTIRLVDVYPNLDYYLSIIDTSYSEDVVLKYSEIFQFQILNDAFEFLPIPNIERNEPFSLKWTYNYNFIDTVDIYLVDKNGNKSLLSSGVPNSNEFSSVFPNNVPNGSYHFFISNKSGIYTGESQSFFIN